MNLEFEDEVKKSLESAGIKNPILEETPDAKFGDISFPCFQLAGIEKKNPNLIAQELQKKVKTGDWIGKTEATGPYLNFWINSEKIVESILAQVNDNYGGKFIKNKNALVEHTSINPNASPHVGRARNALLGDSIVRILRFSGYNVEVHYYINDAGKQIALLVLGARTKGSVNFDELLDVYIKANQDLEKDPTMEKKVFELLEKLEKGDKETKEEFRKIVNTCVEGQKKILLELGIKYDYFDYESDYIWDKKTGKLLKEMEKTGKLFTDDDKRKVLDLSDFKLAMKSPVFVLTRSDNTSLYSLRDIAYTLDKMEKAKDVNLLILGEDQKLYFQQLSAALSLLGKKVPDMVSYSFVLLPDGKMSTRSGNVVLLTEFMEEAIKKALEEVKKRYPLLPKEEAEEKAKIVGLGALKYSILRVNSDKNVIFSWDEALNFEGDSAPYIQYTHARACSILEKAGKVPKEFDAKNLQTPQEILLIKLIGKFPETVKKAAEEYQPQLIANYVYKLATCFNQFYRDIPVLQEGKERESRLYLVNCFRIVLKNSLNLLGIDAPEKM